MPNEDASYDFDQDTPIPVLLGMLNHAEEERAAYRLSRPIGVSWEIVRQIQTLEQALHDRASFLMEQRGYTERPVMLWWGEKHLEELVLFNTWKALRLRKL